MRKILFIFSMFVLSIQSVLGQNIQKLDSLFQNHIKSINDSIDKYKISDETKIHLSDGNREFIEMIEFITDFQFEHDGYTIQPMINRQELMMISKWYKYNRRRININKIEKYFMLKKELMQTYYTIATTDPKEFLKFPNAMDTVYNKLDRLQETSTFIK